MIAQGSLHFQTEGMRGNLLAYAEPRKHAPGQRSLFTSFRAVRGAAYANTIVILYVVTASLGAISRLAITATTVTWIDDGVPHSVTS